MDLILYQNFSKKRNSTLLPTSATYVTKSVTLKEDTSLENPVFLISDIDFTYNYAQFQGAYYFIDDIVAGQNRVWELHCTRDVLATHKSAIGSYTAFIERASSTYDSMINDSALSERQTVTQSTYTQIDMVNDGDTGGQVLSTNGVYLVRAVGSSDDAGDTSPGVTTYIVAPEQMFVILGFLFDEDNFTDVLTDSLVKSFFNPFQYILDIRWVPHTASGIQSASLDTVSPKFGWWTVSNASIPMLQVPTLQLVYDLDISSYGVYSDFRKYSHRFSEYRLTLPGCGTIVLDPLKLTSGSIRITYNIDWDSGNACVRVISGTHYIYENTIPYAVPVKLAQQDSNLISGVASGVLGIASIAGAVATGGASLAAGGALSAGTVSAGILGASTIADGAQKIANPSTQGNGSFGNKSEWQNYHTIIFEVINYASAEFLTSVAGRPLCKNLAISSLSGYIKCNGASLDISGIGSDKDKINAYLNGGFYYE